MRPVSNIESDAVAALLYFDLFRHPLTVEEAYAFLPTNHVTVADVRNAVEQSTRIDRYATPRGEMLLVHGRPEAYVAERLEKEERAAHAWKSAARWGRFIALFPFVRGVFVSGSLSKNVAAHDSDIDWFIITARNRLWISKSFLTLFRRVILLNRTGHFCTNYYVAEDALEIPDRNVFIATEVATVRPVINGTLGEEFARANSWITRYLPNAQPFDRTHLVRKSFLTPLARILELPFLGFIGDWLDERLHAMHRRYFDRKHGGDGDFRLKYRHSKSECKIHHRNFQRHVIDLYRSNLTEFGVERTLGEILNAEL
jgi:hypothetical protein